MSNDAPSDPDLVRACEESEAAALESLTRAVPVPLARDFAIGCERLGQALLIHSNADILMFNRVLGLGALETDVEAILASAIARFQSLGRPRFMIQLAPGPWAAEVAAIAGGHGFVAHNYWVRLARDASPPPNAGTDLTLEPLRPRDAESLAVILVEAFGHPPAFAEWNAAIMAQRDWQFFGAYEGDTLAGGAGLFVHRDSAHFGLAATRPEFRGRGAQSALIAHRIAAARAAGCVRMVVETAADTPEKPNPSTHNLRRLGFRDLYERRNWVKLLA